MYKIVSSKRVNSVPISAIESKIIRTVEDISTGTREINQYQFKEIIGQGSFGVVHLAVDRHGKKYVLFHPSFSKVSRQ